MSDKTTELPSIDPADYLTYGAWFRALETRHLTQGEQRTLSAALRRSTRLLCESCGKFTRDPPSHLCPGCEAYQEHQR